jgi:TatA/E family protein of Tat protein translocase
MFGGLSTTELAIILVIILLIFGAKRVPGMARSLGKGLGEVRRAKERVEDDIGIGQLRRTKAQILHEVKEAAGKKLFRLHREDAKSAKKPQSFLAFRSRTSRLRGKDSRSLNSYAGNVTNLAVDLNRQSEIR